MATLCLNMIVKNESHLIAKTLENLCRYIDFDYWVISDTGSGDNTVEIIQDFFQDRQIAGEIFHDEWKNFAHNRNQALAHCADKADYVLFFDADDEIQGDWYLDKYFTHDAYYMQMASEGGSTRYQRKLIVRNNGNFYWRGVLHEFIEHRKPISIGTVKGDYVVVSGRKGHRNKDQTQKYQRDAVMLEQAILADDDPDLRPRYVFYLAQSYKDAENREKAIEWYKVRSEMLGGWVEERYYSYLQLGFLFEDDDQMLACSFWEKAAAIVPERAEAWYHLARRHSWNKNYPVAYLFARQATECVYPTESRLFLNKAIYDYWVYYEYCLCAFKIGKTEESYTAFKQLLQAAPKDLLERVKGYVIDYQPFLEQDEFREVQRIWRRLKEVGIQMEIDSLVVQ